jgi:hypothetical protein
MNNNNFEEILKFGIGGIKKVKRQKIILKFNSENGVLSDVETGKSYVEKHGIVEGIRQAIVLLPCGHPEGYGIGHEADCGHLICRRCVDSYYLVCAQPGCFRKFCTVRKCRNKPHVFGELPFCRKHYFSIAVEINGLALVLGRERAGRIMDDIRREYRLKHSRGAGKELSYARRNLPGKSNRAFGFPEKNRPVERKNPGSLL